MYNNDQPFGYQPHRMGGYGQMQPMYQPYQPYQQMQTVQQDQTVACRIVTGEEEGRAAQIDFSGKPFISYAPNLKRVYVKAFNPTTGAVDFDTYGKIAEMPKEPVAPSAAALVPADVTEQIRRLEETVADLQQEIRTMKNSKRKAQQTEVMADEV